MNKKLKIKIIYDDINKNALGANHRITAVLIQS